MPEMKEGESKSDWMSRCVPVRVNEGDKQDQAVAVCLSMWRKKNGTVKSFDEVMEEDRLVAKLSTPGPSYPGSYTNVDSDPFVVNAVNIMENENAEDQRDEDEDEADDGGDTEDDYDEEDDDLDKMAAVRAQLFDGVSKEDDDSSDFVVQPFPEGSGMEGDDFHSSGEGPLMREPDSDDDDDDDDPGPIPYVGDKAKLFDAFISMVEKDATLQSVHQSTALGNERRQSDRKRRQLLSTMADDTPRKDEDETSIDGDINSAIKRWSLPLKIFKADPDQQRIFGWASVVMKGDHYVIDKQGDIIPVSELENAVFTYMLESRDHGYMHEKRGTGRLIMSFLTTPEMMKAFGLTQEDGLVGWIAGYQVDDPAVWEQHKRGELPEFSIGGSAMSVELDLDHYDKRAGRVRRHARQPF